MKDKMLPIKVKTASANSAPVNWLMMTRASQPCADDAMSKTSFAAQEAGELDGSLVLSERSRWVVMFARLLSFGDAFLTQSVTCTDDHPCGTGRLFQTTYAWIGLRGK